MLCCGICVLCSSHGVARAGGIYLSGFGRNGDTDTASKIHEKPDICQQPIPIWTRLTLSRVCYAIVILLSLKSRLQFMVYYHIWIAYENLLLVLTFIRNHLENVYKILGNTLSQFFSSHMTMECHISLKMAKHQLFVCLGISKTCYPYMHYEAIHKVPWWGITLCHHPLSKLIFSYEKQNSLIMCNCIWMFNIASFMFSSIL